MTLEVSMFLSHNSYNLHYSLKYVKTVDCMSYYVEILLWLFIGKKVMLKSENF
jgi:hypothetical protein